MYIFYTPRLDRTPYFSLHNDNIDLRNLIILYLMELVPNKTEGARWCSG